MKDRTLLLVSAGSVVILTVTTICVQSNSILFPIALACWIASFAVWAWTALRITNVIRRSK